MTAMPKEIMTSRDHAGEDGFQSGQWTNFKPGYEGIRTSYTLTSELEAYKRVAEQLADAADNMRVTINTGGKVTRESEVYKDLAKSLSELQNWRRGV